MYLKTISQRYELNVVKMGIALRHVLSVKVHCKSQNLKIYHIIIFYPHSIHYDHKDNTNQTAHPIAHLRPLFVIQGAYILINEIAQAQ